MSRTLVLVAMSVVVISMPLSILNAAPQAELFSESMPQPDFRAILKRVTFRDSLSNAVETLDRILRFDIRIEENKARVRIWRNMKVKDPKEENYVFEVTPLIQLEHDRLRLLEKYEVLREAQSLVEGAYRIATYDKGQFKKGMSVKDAEKLLNSKEISHHIHAAAEMHSFSYKGYVFRFKNGLVDIARASGMKLGCP